MRQLLRAAINQRANWHAPAHLALLTVALQGAPIISQAAAALIVPLAVMGEIRTIESALPILILLGSFGASSLAVREVAAAPSDDARQTISRDLLLLSLAGSLLLFIVGIVLLGFAPTSWSPWILSALPLLPLVLLVNINRCLGGAAQGWGRTDAISVPVAIASFIAVICHLAGAWVDRTSGWIAGRYVGELVVMVSFASLLRVTFGAAFQAPVHWPRFGQLAGGAMVLNSAFVLRAAADALPLLALAAAGVADTEVGAFGMATLVLTMAMLPIAVLSQFTLPNLARAAAAKRTTNRRVLQLLFAIGIFAMLGIGGTALLLATFLPADLQIAAHFIALLSVAIPLKAAAIGYGTRLIAAGRFDAPLKGNSIELAAIVLLCATDPTPLRCGLAVIVGAALSLTSLAWLDHRPMRQHQTLNRG